MQNAFCRGCLSVGGLHNLLRHVHGLDTVFPRHRPSSQSQSLPSLPTSVYGPAVLPSPSSHVQDRTPCSPPLPHTLVLYSKIVPPSPTLLLHGSSIVYPAFLSRVAEALHARIVRSDIITDGLTYENAFDGLQAVEKIAYITRTIDRYLALLLGRVFDAKWHFHAVTYDHRLRNIPVPYMRRQPVLG
jgi:hypothetical protein